MPLKSDINQAFLRSLPIAGGYIPMGVAFGLLFAELPYDWWWASCFAIFFYTGSGQFLTIALLAAKAGFIEMVLLNLLVAARHMFYGLSLLKTYETNHYFKKAYLIFGLTDETFSLVAGDSPKKPINHYVLLTLFNQSWWVFGCTLGAWVGDNLPPMPKGMAFSLTALFIVLSLEHYIKQKRARTFAIAGLVGVISAFLLPQNAMLLVSMAVVTLWLSMEKHHG